MRKYVWQLGLSLKHFLIVFDLCKQQLSFIKIKIQRHSSPDKDLGLERSWQGIVESFPSLRHVGFCSVIRFVGLFSKEKESK